MNIAYISSDFGVPVWGCKGASIHLREMVAAFCRAGHSVTVISPTLETAEGEKGKQDDRGQGTAALFPPFAFLPFHSQPLSVSALQGATFFPVPPAQEHHGQFFQELESLDAFMGAKIRLRQELRNLFFNVRLYQKARDYLLLSHVDCIYERYALFSYAGIRLARELGVPHILEVNAPLAYEQEKMRGLELKELAAAVERRIFCETDRVIVVSQNLGEFVASCGVPESRIHILPNAVNPKRFAMLHDENGEAVRARYRLEGKCVIGFVGSLKPWHGTTTLLKAFLMLRAEIPKTHLLIVGEGPEKEALEKYAYEHGLNGAVTFTGNVPYDYIPNYIAAMDITVAPYIPNENFYFSPIKIFEYMAMAKPVVAAGIGQVQEVIKDGDTGLLFEPGNISQLMAALARLERDASLCRRLGENARAWVQQERTWECNAGQVIGVAREILEKSNARKVA